MTETLAPSTDHSAAFKAYSAAVKTLIGENAERFAELKMQERVARGLPAVATTGDSRRELQRKIDRAQQRINKWTARMNGGASE